MFSRIFSLLVAAVVVAALGQAAQAGAILQPVGATSSMGNAGSVFAEQFVIDQSGLAAVYTSGVTDFDTFASTTGTVNGGSGFNTWFSASGNTTGNFDFDLGGLFTIESFALWNDPQATPNQGVNTFNLYADDNPAFSSPTLLGSFAAVDGIPNATNFGQVFTFAPTLASHVRMEILSNHGSVSFTGFVEAAFEVSTVAIPEPNAAMLLAIVAAVSARRSSRRSRP